MSYLAFEIERIDCNLAGGKQDQYAATFGGVNFIEFYENDRVIVNPLRLKSELINELEFNMMLYFTGRSRKSDNIIRNQTKNVNSGNKDPINAMHIIKKNAFLMKEKLLRGNISSLGEIFRISWENKKKMAQGITSEEIDKIYNIVIDNGAYGGKITGAGGGGYLMIIAPRSARISLQNKLSEFGGKFVDFSFVEHGVESWTVS